MPDTPAGWRPHGNRVRREVTLRAEDAQRVNDAADAANLDPRAWMAKAILDTLDQGTQPRRGGA